MAALPMFPLGTALVPFQGLPLHVFEARYRALVRDCLDDGGKLGTVLILRGSEVGGGDVRADVGTMARILEAAELPDGRWVLAIGGDHRIRITRWLEDDPYPRAEVEAWPDEPPAGAAAVSDRLEEVASRLRRALALVAELGEPGAPATVELAADPEVRAWQCVAAAPLGPLDRHRLLSVPGAAERLDLLGALLAEEVVVLEQRLAL